VAPTQIVEARTTKHAVKVLIVFVRSVCIVNLQSARAIGASRS
jgi:hypothetical protein